MDRDRLELAAEVDRLRGDAGLTWTDVAALVGCSRPGLYKALAGSRGAGVLDKARTALSREGLNGPWRLRDVLVGRVGARVYRVRLDTGAVSWQASAARRAPRCHVEVAEDDRETWRRVVAAVGTAGAA